MLAINMIQEKIIESIVTGVSTAISWVLLVYIFNFVRNKILEFKLRKTFKANGTFGGSGYYGVLLTNRTKVDVKIREVILLLEHGSFVLHYLGQKACEYKVKIKIDNKEKTTFNRSTEYDSPSIGPTPLEFYSSAKFGISQELLFEGLKIKNGFVTLDYPQAFGSRKIIKVEFLNIDLIQLFFDEAIKKKLKLPTNKSFQRMTQAPSLDSMLSL